VGLARRKGKKGKKTGADLPVGTSPRSPAFFLIPLLSFTSLHAGLRQIMALPMTPSSRKAGDTEYNVPVLLTYSLHPHQLAGKRLHQNYGTTIPNPRLSQSLAALKPGQVPSRYSTDGDR
jgi:hypothetical protein